MITTQFKLKTRQMKNKKLSPLQKTRETQRAVKKYIKEVLEPKIMDEIESEFKTDLPLEFFDIKNQDVKDFIINKYINQ